MAHLDQQGPIYAFTGHITGLEQSTLSLFENISGFKTQQQDTLSTLGKGANLASPEKAVLVINLISETNSEGGFRPSTGWNQDLIRCCLNFQMFIKGHLLRASRC